MKRLIVIRHAKSSWDDPMQADIGRPLNDRGKKDAPRMARRLNERGVHPQQMISSPAVRALATCEEFARVLGFPLQQIEQLKSVYHASADTLIGVLQNIREMESDAPVLLFGHNPGLTNFVNDLLDEEIDNIPTTGIVGAKLDIRLWSEARPGCGSLEYFDYPKLHK